MRATTFDERYRNEGDPWGYRTRAYEHAKYTATLSACGDGPFRSALELGASIGVFSALLAPRCEQLTTIDFSTVAVAEARCGLRGFDQIEVLTGEIPSALDDRPRDLIVASEILYYLEPEALTTTLERLDNVLLVGARLVLVHWRPAGPERPFSAREVHDRVLALPWLRCRDDRSTADYLLHVLERR
jgi:cyclopropane fatty-acyl-phospholipid synthase-like methyltransferase